MKATLPLGVRVACVVGRRTLAAAHAAALGAALVPAVLQGRAPPALPCGVLCARRSACGLPSALLGWDRWGLPWMWRRRW